MSYQDFLAKKQLVFRSTGKDCTSEDINPILFPFQRDLVMWAVRKGRCALFADTGMGKTLMQLEWARLIGERALILAPLSVARQTVREGERINIEVHYTRSGDDLIDGVNITNYEMVGHFDVSQFGAVVLDESSILKSFNGKTRKMLTDVFKHTPYKLCCTATPAPNDIIEIGRHSEFLGVMTNGAMLSSFFVHEKSPEFHGANYRLKGHSEKMFFKWMASWSMSIRRPSDLGYEDDGFVLPPLNIDAHYVKSEYIPEGQLFFTGLSGIQDRARIRRETLNERCVMAADIITHDAGNQWLVWAGLNDESKLLKELINDSIEVVGSDSPEKKADELLRFQDGDTRVLITKPSIAGFGMNFQNAHNMIFVGLDDSYEKYYQAIRRCYRYGQSNPVNVHIVLSDIQSEIYENVRRKEDQASFMAERLIENLHEFEREELFGMANEDYKYEEDAAVGPNWRLLLGDSVTRMRDIEDDKIGLIVYSPPFNDLFTYSPSERDLGNSTSLSEFFEHYRFIIDETKRVLMPGRTCVVHCENLLASKTHHGYIGMIDFRGDIIRAHQSAGWVYVGEITIDKDPQVQAIRTKNHRLLFITLGKDSSRSRPGLADYLLLFEKPGESPEVIDTDVTEDEWIQWARPVWNDIRETNVLNTIASKEDKDEKHICPLQLDLIERCIRLWSNRGDIVLSPFAGIGSEGYVAIKHGRKFIGIELKPSYWKQAVKNIRLAENEMGQMDLFTWAETQKEAVPDDVDTYLGKLREGMKRRACEDDCAMLGGNAVCEEAPDGCEYP